MKIIIIMGGEKVVSSSTSVFAGFRMFLEHQISILE